MNKKIFIENVETRLLKIFQAYEQGSDVAPAILFRTEGFIEAGCCLGLVTEQDIEELMQGLHQQVFNTELATYSGTGINIPSLMKRAPVYPSTK